MPSPDTLVLFAAAAAALIALPGPAMLLIIGRGVSGGRRVAVATALGVEAATALMVLATAAGLSALIASSALALQVVRWAGIAYLLVLAARALRAGEGLRLRPAGADGDGDGAEPAARAFRTGLAVGLSNPKVVLFFLAFFPQFVDPAAGAAWTQVLVLGAVFVALGLAGDLTYALLAGAVGRWLRRHPGFAARTHLVEAGTFAGMAAVLGVTGEARAAVRSG